MIRAVGPAVWLGQENYRRVGGYLNYGVCAWPLVLFHALLIGGVFIFSIRPDVEIAFLADIMMCLPRVAFDVGVFTEAGGVLHGRKCLFLYELMFVGLAVCLASYLWLWHAISRRIDFGKLGDSDLLNMFLFLLS